MGHFPNNPESHENQPDSGELDRAQELTWALLDEQITDDEFWLLDNLLLSDDAARNAYIGCVQLHADLMAHFAAPRNGGGTNRSKTPVLGCLSETTPPLEWPSAEA